jgi:hypothetical protein
MQYSVFTKWIDKLWLTSVWQHTGQSQMVDEIASQWTPTWPRLHNIFLMEYALNLNHNLNLPGRNIIWEIFLLNFHRNGKLHTPLGPWIHTTHQQWAWFFDDSSSNVFHLTQDNKWLCHSPVVVSTPGRRLCSHCTW